MDSFWSQNFTLDTRGSMVEVQDNSAAAKRHLRMFGEQDPFRSDSPDVQFLGVSPPKPRSGSYSASPAVSTASVPTDERGNQNMLRNPASVGGVVEPVRPVRPALIPQFYNIDANTPIIDESFVRRNTEMEERPGGICRGAQAPKHTCFNCCGAHMISECPKPRDPQQINKNRRKFQNTEDQKRRTAPRYMETQSTHFVPGILSESLRGALGLESHQLPNHIYKMRHYGYPPGHLESAKVSSSGLMILDGRKAQENNSGGFDRDRLYAFAGYNSPVPPGQVDEFRKLGAPRFSSGQNINLFYDHIQEPYKRQQSANRKRDYDSGPEVVSPSKRCKIAGGSGSDRTSTGLKLQNPHAKVGSHDVDLRVEIGQSVSPVAFVDYSMLFSPGSKDIDMRLQSLESSFGSEKAEVEFSQRFLPNPVFKTTVDSSNPNEGLLASSATSLEIETTTSYKSPARVGTPVAKTRPVSPSLLEGYSYRADSPGTLERAEKALALHRAKAQGLRLENKNGQGCDEKYEDDEGEIEELPVFKPTPVLVDLDDEEMCLIKIRTDIIQSSQSTSSQASSSCASSNRLVIDLEAVTTSQDNSEEKTESQRNSESQRSEPSTESSGMSAVAKCRSTQQPPPSQITETSGSTDRLIIDEDSQRLSQDSQDTGVSTVSSGRLIIDEGTSQETLDSQSTQYSLPFDVSAMLDPNAVPDPKHLGILSKCLVSSVGNVLDGDELFLTLKTKELAKKDVEYEKNVAKVCKKSDVFAPVDPKVVEDCNDLSSLTNDEVTSSENSPMKNTCYDGRSPLKARCADPGETQNILDYEEILIEDDEDEDKEPAIESDLALPQEKKRVGIYINEFRELPSTANFAKGMVDLLLHEPSSTGRFDRVLNILKKKKPVEPSRCFARREFPESPPT